ncbi:MAG: 50S ribosomal protein L15 [Spirochaetia bacterium]|jgi:large subunit ribosomal protein L15|nr:50S ribosomal protein L15 [Spirochaetia bacterium]
MEDLILKAPHGANKTRKRIGRGVGSGLGKTSGKGHKGQNSRSGGGVRPGFEGGQMPIYRRVASRGFSNYPFKTSNVVINISDLETLFNNGDQVDLAALKEKSKIKKNDFLVKLLGDGDLTKKLDVELPFISASAKEKIEKAGGRIVTAENKESR